MKHVLARYGRVVLRRLGPADTLRFVASRNDPKLARFQGWQQMKTAGALRFLAHVQTAPLLVPGAWMQIGIARSQSPAVLCGDIGLCLSPCQTEVELGITLASEAQGQGYGQEAIIAALHLVRRHSRARHLLGITDMRNAASLRLLGRCGFVPKKHEATLFQGTQCREMTLIKRL